MLLENGLSNNIFYYYKNIESYFYLYYIEFKSTSFFGIFDGHGGTRCADYLRDNLHHLIIKDQNFP